MKLGCCQHNLLLEQYGQSVKVMCKLGDVRLGTENGIRRAGGKKFLFGLVLKASVEKKRRLELFPAVLSVCRLTCRQKLMPIKQKDWFPS